MQHFLLSLRASLLVLSMGLDKSKLVRTGQEWLGLARAGQDIPELVRTGPDWSEQVRSGHF